jgi:hypothetical protein
LSERIIRETATVQLRALRALRGCQNLFFFSGCAYVPSSGIYWAYTCSFQEQRRLALVAEILV